MINEKYNQIIHESYENYSKVLVDSITFSERNKYFKVNGLEFNSGYPNYIHFTKEEFIDKCKTDIEFSERWGLMIEKRELCGLERWSLCKNEIDVDDADLYSKLDRLNIPTKLITITYNNETIESYE